MSNFILKITSLPVSVFAIVFSGLISASAGAAPKSDFECMKGDPGQEVCMVTPDDAPAKTVLPSQKAGDRASILKPSDLSGGALDLQNDFLLSDMMDPLEDEELRKSEPQHRVSGDVTKMQDELRRIETYLKAGPSSVGPDVRVSTSAKRK